MTEMDLELWTVDLMRRTESALEDVAHLAIDTEVSFQIDDVVRLVVDRLPADYPLRSAELWDCEPVIANMARDLLSGEAYEE
ncbi:hypothetical protein ACIQU6_33990 [Streptomyces sp. NPDC090442]|uniref:hypothetical protein n=1 Tax=Streptomyces sp. NPDC090442 TaxID=3365962 RepID=UPI003811FAA4